VRCQPAQGHGPTGVRPARVARQRQSAEAAVAARVAAQPDLYLKLLSELRSPHASIHRAAAVISNDPGMTAKLLQLVNSAFFGIQQHVADPQRAASILGLNTITALVLSVKVFSQYDARLMQSREFSASTQTLCLTTLTDLARYHQRSPDTLDGPQVQDYLLYLTRERHLAWSSVSVAASAIRFFYAQTLKRPEIAMAIPPRRKPRRLPHILSVEEVGRLLSGLHHPTHSAVLMTTYAAGMRVAGSYGSQDESVRTEIPTEEPVVARKPAFRSGMAWLISSVLVIAGAGGLAVFISRPSSASAPADVPRAVPHVQRAVALRIAVQGYTDAALVVTDGKRSTIAWPGRPAIQLDAKISTDRMTLDIIGPGSDGKDVVLFSTELSPGARITVKRPYAFELEWPVAEGPRGGPGSSS